jgi:GNAT superfamily N-acetyltransferase
MRDMTDIERKLQSAGIGLKDAIALLHMAFGDHGEDHAHLLGGLFKGLHESIHRTVHGTRVERFRPTQSAQPFHVFEIHTEEGEALGYLNTIYLRKPIPCHYLVYVEVLPPFRGRGLGTKILEAFRTFLERKGTVGLLDNIIPREEPTFEMYSKLGYQPVEEAIGREVTNGEGNYMVWVPDCARHSDLPEKLTKLLFNLRRKRQVIDMKDNEAMVKRTIEEFRAVQDSLVRLFRVELSTGATTPLMRFMFTKFVTKLIGFRRRIASLLGYTGGESLEQIPMAREIHGLPILPYSLWGPEPDEPSLWGDHAMIQGLPPELMRDPTRFVESLPIYRRPYLASKWGDLGEMRASDLRLADLLELGFDPTRLREWIHKGEPYIVERSSPRFLAFMKRKARLLTELDRECMGIRFRTAVPRINPPVSLVSHRGNLYVFRRKVEGIHSEEALDQLRGCPGLRGMNDGAGIDSALLGVMREGREWLVTRFASEFRDEIDDLTFFFPWDLERNLPRVSVDAAGVSIDTIWLA